MYERFYNLRERPFALSPDPEYLYLSRVHREALDSIRYGLESRAGFIVITGDIGAGKTTLLQTILGRLDDRTVVARIVNTTLDARELLEAILLEFGVDTTGKSKPALLRDLGQLLVKHRSEGRRPLLVIDEAQNLGPQVLEEVRLLSNLESEKSKLLQILLAGQPNLRDAIASPELEQFRQRVAVSYHLTPLDRDETAAYINSRLSHAAIGVPPRFPEDAADLVHERSRGVPRIINVICDAALVFGYAEERHEIDFSLIRDVVGELESTGVLQAHRTNDVPPAPLTREAPAPVVRAAVAAPAVQPHAVPHVASRRLDAPPVPVPAMVDTARMLAAIEGREQALAIRERELAEQRRVLAEECRLLRERRVAATAVASAAGRVPAAPAARVAPPGGSPTVRGRTVPGRVGAPAGQVPPRPPAAVHFRSPRHEGFLAWLRRMLVGWSHRALEGTRSLHGS